MAERRLRRPMTSATGTHSSARYCGAKPCKHLNTSRHSLNVMRCGTSSQCRSSCTNLVRPRSNYHVPLMTCAAAFMTRCSAVCRSRSSARLRAVSCSSLWRDLWSVVSGHGDGRLQVVQLRPGPPVRDPSAHQTGHVAVRCNSPVQSAVAIQSYRRLDLISWQRHS